MLSLTRREGETIVIGGKITVTITKIKSTQVRVAIQAPDGMDILREELVSSERFWKEEPPEKGAVRLPPGGQRPPGGR